MTIIYLTNTQYQQIINGMVSTHLDKLDYNKDGIITQTDGLVAVAHTPLDDGHAQEYVWARTGLIDEDDNSYVDVMLIGLSAQSYQPIGYSEAAIEAEGELYAYDVETLNKVIDYYNNGGSWNDDDFEKHVYNGIGATGQKAPEGKYKTAEEMAMQNIAKSNVVTDETEEEGMFIYELKQAGATDFKYTSDGMLASYTLNGVTYNISSNEYGNYSSNGARTQELLDAVSKMGDRVNLSTSETSNINSNQTTNTTNQSTSNSKQTTTINNNSILNARYEAEVQKLNEELEEATEIQNEIDAIEDEIEQEKSNAQQAYSLNNSNSENNSTSEDNSYSSYTSNISNLNYKSNNLYKNLTRLKNSISNRSFILSYYQTAMGYSRTTNQMSNYRAQVNAKYYL